MLVAAAPVGELAAGPRSPARKRSAAARIFEASLVLASPVVLFFVLRLRAMAPPFGPDPSMHTVYIIDPRDFSARFSSQLAAMGGSREGARVGFLVPARLSYLAFGAVPGFFVFRYALALVAVVPAYVLLRRLYCRAAGVVAIVILMSSPVLVTAWGTDYPDSAAVSYLTGALACLAMPCGEKRRSAWLALAASLFTLAVWSSIAAAPLVAATMLAYVAICLLRTPRRLLPEALVLGGSAVVVTGALMLASGVLLGSFDYILPTIRASAYLNLPAIVRRYHSTNRRWILLRPYLLAPAAAVAAWAATFLRRLRSVPTPQLLIGVSCAAQIAAFAYLQFLNHAELLQQHYYSSSLWAAICLVLAITIGALAKPLLNHHRARWLPGALAVAIPLIYETDPHLPAFGWWPTGLLVVAAMTVAAGMGRLVPKPGGRIAQATAGAVVAVVIGCPLILTAAPYEHHARLPGVINNPVPAYATALGGSDGIFIDRYRVATDLPQFVGNSRYPGERLLMWYPTAQVSRLIEVIGIYLANGSELATSPPHLTARDKEILQATKPAELLVFNTPNFPATLRALGPYDPTLLRATVLKSGDYVLRAWLVSLGAYMHRDPA